jgi:hypothetical protein
VDVADLTGQIRLLHDTEDAAASRPTSQNRAWCVSAKLTPAELTS